MSSSQKNLTCEGTLRQVFICLMPLSPLAICRFWIWSDTEYKTHAEYGLQEDSTPRAPQCLYILYLEPERRLEGQQFTKLGPKCQHDWLCLQSINFNKHLPQSPFTGKFLYDVSLFLCLYSYHNKSMVAYHEAVSKICLTLLHIKLRFKGKKLAVSNPFLTLIPRSL